MVPRNLRVWIQVQPRSSHRAGRLDADHAEVPLSPVDCTALQVADAKPAPLSHRSRPKLPTESKHNCKKKMVRRNPQRCILCDFWRPRRGFLLKTLSRRTEQ